MRLFARTLLLISSLASGMAAVATISSPVMAANYPTPKPPQLSS
jgi:hypothetical protein